MKKVKVQKIIQILKRYYGKPRFTHFSEPLDELIVTVLSQNTNWRNTWRAFKNLKKTFKNWQEVYLAKISQIKRSIQTGGLANVKSKVIKGILKKIRRDQEKFSLRFLKDCSFQKAWEYLNSFKGVGPKTASCVLLFSLKMPALPVDTHILRVSKRLGLINEKTRLEEAHQILGEIVGKNLNSLSCFHINMILHGRRICRAQNPQCFICPLRSQCRYFSRSKM